MTPYEQSVAQAIEFIVDKLGKGPEVREVLFYIKKLETENATLRQQNSDYGWQINPDRMGS